LQVRHAHPTPTLNEMNENNFQVVITNQLKADQDKNLITKKLAALFKIDEQKAAQFLLKPQTLIKDNLDQATANKYLAAIQQTGASCKVIDKNELEDLPQIVEPPKTESITAKPRDTSRPTIRTKQEPELSLIAREEKSEKETREKLATLQHASEETLCPECGTIRGDADALCLHCGYSPSATENTGMGINKKKIAMFAVILIIVAAIALSFGVSFMRILNWPLIRAITYQYSLTKLVSFRIKTWTRICRPILATTPSNLLLLAIIALLPSRCVPALSTSPLHKHLSLYLDM